MRTSLLFWAPAAACALIACPFPGSEPTPATSPSEAAAPRASANSGWESSSAATTPSGWGTESQGSAAEAAAGWGSAPSDAAPPGAATPGSSGAGWAAEGTSSTPTGISGWGGAATAEAEALADPKAAALAITGERLVIIFDNSGSMGLLMNGRTKMELAADSLDKALDKTKNGTGIALVAFKGECDTQLVLPWSPDNIEQVKAAVRKLDYSAKTPLGSGLATARAYIKQSGVSARIILFTDGTETCGGDPVLEAELFGNEQVPVEGIDILSFDVKAEDKALLDEIPKALGRGHTVHADDEATLETAMQEVIAEAPPPAPVPATEPAPQPAPVVHREPEVAPAAREPAPTPEVAPTPPATEQPEGGFGRVTPPAESAPVTPPPQGSVTPSEGTLLIRARTYEIWTTHGEQAENRIGMRVHLRMTLENHQGVAFRARARLFTAAGQPLLSDDSRFQDRAGQVVADAVFTPAGTDTAVFEDLSIFVPYEELHVEPGRRHDLRVNVEVSVLQAHYPLVTSADEYFYVAPPR